MPSRRASKKRGKLWTPTLGALMIARSRWSRSPVLGGWFRMNGATAPSVLMTAGFFAGLGVKPGDMVAVLLPNSLDFVRVWLGLGRLGALAVLLNTELTGGFLRHQLESSGATLAVVDRARIGVLQAIGGELTHLRRIIVVGADGLVDAERFEAIAWQSWKAATAYAGPLPRPQDIACIMYTSGTSGQSKCVLMPHAHCYLYGLGTIDALRLTSEDRCYIVLSLFHANGLLMQLGPTLIAGIPLRCARASARAPGLKTFVTIAPPSCRRDSPGRSCGRLRG